MLHSIIIIWGLHPQGPPIHSTGVTCPDAVGMGDDKNHQLQRQTPVTPLDVPGSQ